MSPVKSMEQNQLQQDPATSPPRKDTEFEQPGVNQVRLKLKREQYSFEAKRRSSFVRGIGSPVAGYVDGYADGFEHAMKWLLGEISDPFAADYRPDAGMAFAKTYYICRPKDRKATLEQFEKMGAANDKL
jgi:hypothetical protein